MGAKERFIQDTLRQEGEKMIQAQGKRISSVLERRTGVLMSGRRAQASSDKLTFTHPIYERFLDMKRRSTSSGRKGGKRRSSGNRKIHNRYVFGAYNSIAQRLMYGFTDEVAEQYRRLDENT